MNVKSTTVTKLTVTGIQDLDPVNVFVEEYSPTSGKITMECFGGAWSYYWGSIGNRSIMEFFCSCDNHYLSGKFAPQLETRVDDEGGLEKHAKAFVINERKEGYLTKEEARRKWDRTPYIEMHIYEDLHDIYGDDFWDATPKKPNHKWEYLCRVIDAAKAAVATMIPAKAVA
jgi:hypothetical protein